MKRREFDCPSGSKPTGADRLSRSLSIFSFRLFLMLVAAIPVADLAFAQTTRLSIATGGTGGVYYPLGGAMAALISKHLPGTDRFLAQLVFPLLSEPSSVPFRHHWWRPSTRANLDNPLAT